MSIKVMSLIWDIHTESLTSTEKMILLRMADFSADDGSSIYPGYARISRDTSISMPSIKRTIKSLIGKGLLIKVKKENPKLHLAAEFKINVEGLFDLKKSTYKQNIPGITVIPKDGGGGVMVIPGGGITVIPQPSLTTTKNINPLIPLPGEMVFSKKKSIEEEFEKEVWDLYPLKVAKAAALRAYRSSRISTPMETIVNGVNAYKSKMDALLEKKRNNAKEFVPNYAYFSTWLRAERWKDSDISVDKKIITPSMINESISALPDIKAPGVDFDLLRKAAREFIHREGWETYQSWFAKLKIDRFVDGMVYFSSGSRFMSEYMKNNFSQSIIASLQKANISITGFEIEA